MAEYEQNSYCVIQAKWCFSNSYCSLYPNDNWPPVAEKSIDNQLQVCHHKARQCVYQSIQLFLNEIKNRKKNCLYIYLYMTVFNPVNSESGTVPSRTIKIFKNGILNLSNPGQELNANKLHRVNYFFNGKFWKDLHLLAALMEDVISVWKKRYKIYCTLIFLNH